MSKNNLKNQNHIHFLKKEPAGKRYCHCIFANPCLSSEKIDDIVKKRIIPINTKKNNNILQVYPCIWAYGLFFEHIKKTMFHCFLLIQIQHNLLVSQLSKINNYSKYNSFQFYKDNVFINAIRIYKMGEHNNIRPQKRSGHWIINKRNLIFKDFSVVNKKDLLFAVPRQIKSSKKFLFLANLNLETLILTKIIPILWQASKKNQNQNTLYLIFRKYWLKLKTYYFYMKKRLKKDFVEVFRKKKNTLFLCAHTYKMLLYFYYVLKKKSNTTLFFKNIIKIKSNINEQIQFLPFVFRFSYAQSLTINKFATKQQDQSLSQTEFVDAHKKCYLTKKKFFYKQLYTPTALLWTMLCVCFPGKYNKNLFFVKNKRPFVRYLFFYKKFKKVKNIQKTFYKHVFLKKNIFIKVARSAQNKIYLYTYYFNTCS